MLTSLRLSAPLVLLISVQAADVPVQYGPQNCVQLTKSSQGSCVITPHCHGISLADFDFGFICTDKNGEEVEHVFDGGEAQGFEEGVAFDTGIECTKCAGPEPEQVLVAKNTTAATTSAPADAAATTAAPADAAATTAAPADDATTAAPAAAAATGPPATAAFYGPNGCVATYLNPKGSCMVQTRCKPAEIKDFNFGLTCVDGAGASVRHLFGSDSFDAVETFDTLIDCKMCLGLSSDHLQDSDQLKDQVAQLKTDMAEMKDAVKEIKEELGMGQAATTAAATTAAATTAAPADDSAESDDAEETAAEETTAAPADQGFLRAKSHHKKARKHKAVKAHHKKARHHERLLEEDDTEDDVGTVADLDLDLEDY